MVRFTISCLHFTGLLSTYKQLTISFTISLVSFFSSKLVLVIHLPYGPNLLFTVDPVMSLKNLFIRIISETTTGDLEAEGYKL